MCMYVCMYVCTYVCKYVCMYVNIYILCACIYLLLYPYICFRLDDVWTCFPQTHWDDKLIFAHIKITSNKPIVNLVPLLNHFHKTFKLFEIKMKPNCWWETNVKALWANVENGKWEATLDCFKLRVWIWLALQRRALSGSGDTLNASSDKPWATSGGRSHLCPPRVYSTSPEASTRWRQSFKLITTESLPFSWRSAWQLVGMGEQTKGVKIYKPLLSPGIRKGEGCGISMDKWLSETTGMKIYQYYKPVPSPGIAKVEEFGTGDYKNQKDQAFCVLTITRFLWRLKDLGWVTVTNLRWRFCSPYHRVWNQFGKFEHLFFSQYLVMKMSSTESCPPRRIWPCRHWRHMDIPFQGSRSHTWLLDRL